MSFLLTFCQLMIHAAMVLILNVEMAFPTFVELYVSDWKESTEEVQMNSEHCELHGF